MAQALIHKNKLLVNFDKDTKNFINAAGLNNESNLNVSGLYTAKQARIAVHLLITGLKAIGVWNKCKAIYVFIGGNELQHKLNLKDPRDLDAAFRLSFLGGGWIHSGTGAKPNGTSSYADTFLNPNIQGLTNINNHLSVYTNTPIITNQNIISSRNNMSIPSILSLSKSTTGTSYSTSNSINRGNNLSVIPPVRNLGYTIASVLSTVVTILTNGISYQMFNSSLGSDLPPNYNLYLASDNVEGLAQAFSNTELRFISIGEGITGQQAVQMSNIIELFEAQLNRKI